MAEPIVLTDADWQSAIGNQPALILLSNGEGLRSDFATEFKKAAANNNTVIFAKINPKDNPQAAQLFRAKEKPLLIGYYKGDEVVRKTRPWGSDVVLGVELLEDKHKEEVANDMSDDNAQQQPDEQPTLIEAGKPVVVTDQTFQQEVIDYSKDMPVLVDFWAEWCGPCRMVAPILEKIAADFEGQIRIAKVDTDQNQGLAQYFQIMSIPTIMAIKNSTIVFNQPGALPEEAFRDLVQQLIDLEVPEPEVQEQPE